MANEQKQTELVTDENLEKQIADTDQTKPVVDKILTVFGSASALRHPEQAIAAMETEKEAVKNKIELLKEDARKEEISLEETLNAMKRSIKNCDDDIKDKDEEIAQLRKKIKCHQNSKRLLQDKKKELKSRVKNRIKNVAPFRHKVHQDKIAEVTKELDTTEEKIKLIEEFQRITDQDMSLDFVAANDQHSDQEEQDLEQKPKKRNLKFPFYKKNKGFK